jgi:hypothetical protein
MPARSILLEVQQLYGVCRRLDSIANQHPGMEETLLAISGSIHNSATC